MEHDTYRECVEDNINVVEPIDTPYPIRFIFDFEGFWVNISELNYNYIFPPEATSPQTAPLYYKYNEKCTIIDDCPLTTNGNSQCGWAATHQQQNDKLKQQQPEPSSNPQQHTVQRQSASHKHSIVPLCPRTVITNPAGDKAFVVKEMGYIDCISNRVYSRFYKIGNTKKMSGETLRNIKYVTNRIHGLAYRDNYAHVYEHTQDMVFNDILCLSEIALLNNHHIAFKGGVIEKYACQQMNITNYIDLESWGCPKFERILNQVEDSQEMLKLSVHRCPFHTNSRNYHSKCIPHCPRMEVAGFLQWLTWHVNTSKTQEYEIPIH